MYDKIECKIEFEVPSEERAREIYDFICVVGKEINSVSLIIAGIFDFYCSETNREEDEEDKERFWKFALYDCNFEFWYEEFISSEIGELERFGDKASFAFQTLYGVPYQLVALFANEFNVPFTLKHIEKTGKYWGIETFELDENERIRKTSERVCMEEDFRELHIEFMGYEPEQDEVPFPATQQITNR